MKRYFENLLNNLGDNLQGYKYYQKTWIVILVSTIILFGLGAIPLGYLFSSHGAATDIVINLNSTFAEVSKILVYVSYGAIGTVYLFLAGVWITGINNITKSKYFHLFLWVAYSIAATLLIIAIILCFRAIIV